MGTDLDSCLRGDKRAWDAFVEANGHVIYAVASRVLRASGITPAGRAEDIAQEVFLRLIREDFRLLRTYDPGKASLQTWLALITRSVTIDHLRKWSNNEGPIEDADVVAKPSAIESSAAPDIPPDLLTPRQCLVLKLLFERELSVEEVAGLLRIDAQTVRSTKHKALQRLREHFGLR
jgi:RNA polymerase sigma-70 factor (ECF subfamily)